MPGKLLRVCARNLGACSVAAAMGWSGTARAQAPLLPSVQPTQESPAAAPLPLLSSILPTSGTGPDPFVIPEAGFPVIQVQAPPRLGADVPPAGEFSTDIQNAPGADGYLSRNLYDVMIRESNSLEPAVSAVPLADYAPRGYFPRDQQDSPAVPEFARVFSPMPAVTAEERKKFVTRGLSPGSFLVPGSNTSIRFRGFVRLTGMFDFDPIRSRDDFVTNTIPVPQEVGQNLNMTARPTRFTMETWTPTTINDWNVHTLIEGDFFNGPAQAVGGGGNPFRLRFAFIDFGYFRVGQQNTVFMDAQTWPALVDFAGPRGWVNQRRPGVRMTVPICDKWYWAAGVEQPFSDITTDGLGRGVQDVPDFATHIRYEADLGHMQVAALGRSIGYEQDDGHVTRRGAIGMSAAGVIHPWAAVMGTNPVTEEDPSGLTRSRMIGQYTCGWGIARYIQDTAGLGLDGQVDQFNDSFALPYVAGWLVSYEHWLNAKWLSSVTYSAVLAASTDGQPGDTYGAARYLAANVWYIPLPHVSIGAEYMYGQRRNIDTESADAHRVQMMFQYNF